ncbi:primase-helicase family protein [Mesorhizobium sp.]|uniref:primase-helicase family protein n=1 Tax=Mesorhizobium sp. TaxID=1871066 RepID=UPI000FE84D6D|nr:primase-helicase family protein [Mesorhizobium sp.]RWN54142.1 MAG: hypothetical protein EOS00_29085 [Mesorhizobium sp.]
MPTKTNLHSTEGFLRLLAHLPEHAGELEIALDKPDDPEHAPAVRAKTDSKQIEAFLAKHASGDFVVSMFKEDGTAFGFTLLFEADSPAIGKLPVPSVAMKSADTIAATYLFREGEDVEVLAVEAKKAGHRLSAEMPFGPKWTWVYSDSVPHYAVAEFVDVLAEWVSTEIPAHWNVIGKFPAGVLDRRLSASVMQHQRRLEAANVFTDVRGLCEHLSRHEESREKEGFGIVGAVLANDTETQKPRRKVRNAVKVGFIGFDIDGRQAADDAAVRLRRLGIVFIMYSSYNHLKDGQTEKFRVIIPLKLPFDTSQYGSRERANAVWKASYEAFGEAVGLHYDPAAKDIVRFFNSPRHPKGGEFFSRMYGGDLFELPIMVPEDRPLAKIAKKKGVKLEYDATGEVYVAEGSGVDFFLSLIGDGEDQLGFHNPIYRALCSYFAAEGLDAEVGPIFKAILDAIQRAEKGTGRAQSDIDRYMSDDYLTPDAENARRYIKGQQDAKELARKELLASCYAEVETFDSLSSDDDIQTLLQDCARLPPLDTERVLKIVAKNTGLSITTLKKSLKHLCAIERDKGEKPTCHFDNMKDAIAALNEEIAFVERGSGVMIVQKREVADGWKNIRAAEDIYRPWIAGKGADREPVFPYWLASSDRDHRTDIVFEPYPYGESDPVSPTLYNMYKGFAIEPAPGDWMSYQRHAFHVVCNGDMRLFEFYMPWLADLYQNPGRKIGTALMLRGLKGTGKSIFTEPLTQIWGLRHSVKVSNLKQLTGNFNGHMDAKMLVVAEESFWGGDKQADSSIKDMITSDTMMMERKFMDAVEVSDRRRFILLSNAENVIRATPDERRYAATVVSDARRGDAAYFEALATEIKSGRIASAMLHDLLNLDISSVDLRRPPRTAALMQQIATNFPDRDKWLRGVLTTGSFTVADGRDLLDERTAEKWQTESIRIAKEQVYESFRSAVRPYSGGQIDPGEIGKFFVGAFKETDAEIGDIRPGRLSREYILPPLPALVAAYESKWAPLNPETTEDERDFIRVVDRNDPDECRQIEKDADVYINAFFKR